MATFVEDMGMMHTPQGHVAASWDEALSTPLIAGATTSEAVVRLGDLAGMDFHAVAPSGHELVMDVGAGDGGHDLGIHPKEMLLVALAGCTGVDVISILRKKRQVVTGYRIRVAATERETHPRVYTQIVVRHIVAGPALDPRAVARAVELSATKYCPVSAMLRAACPVIHEFQIVVEPTSV